MKNGRFSMFAAVSLIALFIGSLAFTNNAGAAEKKKIFKWKIQSAYPRGDVSMELLKVFAKNAEERSNGQLKITVFAEPELVPGEQLFEATQRGTIDMLHALGAMWGGIVPVGEVEFGLPYAWRIPGDLKISDSSEAIREFFFESGFVDLLRKEYGKHGLYWLDMHTYGPIFTVSTKPIKKCEDLKGKKMRMEGAWMKYYDMLGARGTYISGMEAYMGLKLGTLDGSQWDVSCMTALKWYEVAPYWLRGVDPDHCIGHILVNQKSWNALPDNCREALKGAGNDYFHALVKVHEEELKKVAQLVKDGKVIESWLDEDCRKTHAEVAYKLWEEIGKSDPAAAKAIAMIKEWKGLKK